MFILFTASGRCICTWTNYYHKYGGKSLAILTGPGAQRPELFSHSVCGAAQYQRAVPASSSSSALQHQVPTETVQHQVIV